MTTDLDKAGEVLERARQAAIDYYALTGKPLGITGEIGEYLTVRLLGLQLVDAREPGYDAIDSTGRKIQIKARSIPKAKRRTGQRLGSIRLDHSWDCVLLILMNETFEPQAIFEAGRSALEQALTRPGSRARNERGALAVGAFIAIGDEVWRKEEHPE